VPRFEPDRLDPNAYVAPGLELPVMYGDLDTQEHVNNVALQRYFEQLRYITHIEGKIVETLYGAGKRLVVAHIGVDFLGETFFGSPLLVRSRLGRIGKTSIVEEQAAWQDGRCVAVAEVVSACRGADGGPAQLDDAAIELLQRIYTV
jgi:acyl-CoA thioester hydrolase